MPLPKMTAIKIQKSPDLLETTDCTWDLVSVKAEPISQYPAEGRKSSARKNIPKNAVGCFFTRLKSF